MPPQADNVARWGWRTRHIFLKIVKTKVHFRCRAQCCPDGSTLRWKFAEFTIIVWDKLEATAVRYSNIYRYREKEVYFFFMVNRICVNAAYTLNQNLLTPRGFRAREHAHCTCLSANYISMCTSHIRILFGGGFFFKDNLALCWSHTIHAL